MGSFIGWYRLALSSIVMAFTIAGCAAPTTPIDFEAEYTRIIMQGQSADPGALNGWPELTAIALQCDSLIQAIEDQEHAADRQVETDGMDPYIEWGLALESTCGRIPEPREVRVRDQMLRVVADSGVFEQLSSVHAADIFRADVTNRISAPSNPPVRDIEGLVAMRKLAKVCICAMRADARSGNAGGAVARLRDAALISDALSRQAGVMAWLIAIAVEDLTLNGVIEVIWESDHIPIELVAEAMRMVATRDIASVDKALPAARLEAIEMRDRADEIRGRPHSESDVLLLPRPALSRAGMIRLIDRAYADAQEFRTLDPREARAAIASNKRTGSAWRERDRWDEMWADGFRHLVVTEKSFAMASRGDQLVFAIAVYSARHGVPPTTLDALVPEVLPALPTDPFARDGRFRYIVGPTLRESRMYSVGLDGEDNAGACPASLRDRALNPKGAGTDFVLWPPQCASGSAPGTD